MFNILSLFGFGEEKIYKFVYKRANVYRADTITRLVTAINPTQAVKKINDIIGGDQVDIIEFTVVTPKEPEAENDSST